ncbi:MAG: hypothetical protein ACHQNV_06105 [Vicinamibacteria bacterium]
MTTDELDRILGSDESIGPSSGFAAAVMHRVRERAAEPAPVAFPWGRFAVGLFACGVAAAAGSLLVQRNATTLLDMTTPLTGAAPELAWAAFSLLFGLAATRLPRLLRL